MKTFIVALCACLICVPTYAQQTTVGDAPTWTADNGNGTYTNPLFYDEFSDPDIIRVGEDYYMTGTSMHAMPGLAVLHSKDLVNWEFLGYALDKLDLGPAYRMQNGQNIYGQGIWAPSFRNHNGTFYIFCNVNHETTQVFRATDPRGPWLHTQMKRSFHDLSVMFDDDGKTYVIWGYRSIHIAKLNDDLTDIAPGSERTLFPNDSAMGEGSHFYKINGKYYIISAWYEQRMRMVAARADSPYGPYEVLPAIAIDEDFGLVEGRHLSGTKPPLRIYPPNPQSSGHLSMHQGGIVQTPFGEWWGFSMMDYNSVGRLTMLSPVTWRDGWPFFGLPGNLLRTPRTWVKPHASVQSVPHAPYTRNDDFDGHKLKPIWQWNHVPDDNAWSLVERQGYLRLHALGAEDFWHARNSLTQRAIGPVSTPTAKLDAQGLEVGDVAGLAVLDYPYAWVGVQRDDIGSFIVKMYSQYTDKYSQVKIDSPRIWLRAYGDFLRETVRFQYSTDGKEFHDIGDPVEMVFQLVTFQGVRYALFAYNSAGKPGGFVDFDSFAVDEPHPHGLMRPIPYRRNIFIASAGKDTGLHVGTDVGVGSPSVFSVIDLGLGRVALQADGKVLSVRPNGSVHAIAAKPTASEAFQWMETPTGELILMSLVTNRYLRADIGGTLRADSPGPKPDGSDGVRFVWSYVQQ